MRAGDRGPVAPSALAVDRAVRIRNNAYSPEVVAVDAGDRVTWHNDDNRTHTATADDGSWTTGPIDPDDSAARTFRTAGTFAYHCEIHSQMTGTVRVTAASSGTTSSTSSTTSSSTTTSTTATTSTTTTTTLPPTTFALDPVPEDPTTTTTTTPAGSDGQAAPPADPSSGDDAPAAASALAALLLLGTSAATMSALRRTPAEGFFER